MRLVTNQVLQHRDHHGPEFITSRRRPRAAPGRSSVESTRSLDTRRLSNESPPTVLLQFQGLLRSAPNNEEELSDCFAAGSQYVTRCASSHGHPTRTAAASPRCKSPSCRPRSGFYVD